VNVLGIETSCDDTSAAVYSSENGLISNLISSQMEHAEYGGVVPEIASRAHLSLIIPVIDTAVGQAGLTLGQIDSIAVTSGPGLVGSLLVGVSVAKAFALSKGIPMIGIHHIEGHIFSNFIQEPFPSYPSIVLVVSGGHTELVLMKEPLDYQLLGSTRDDAAGEAFDKVAKYFGLGYPGGPIIQRESSGGNENFCDFPVSRVPGYEFSFSGLKTAVMNYAGERRNEFVREHLKDILSSFQRAVIDALVIKTMRSLEEYGIKTLLLAGGVAANKELRSRLSRESEERGFRLFVPPIKFCTDNAAMIARAGYERLSRGMTSPLTLSPESRLPL
jgi:N6-L-threonylcarbamoyladenine synthase